MKNYSVILLLSVCLLFAAQTNAQNTDVPVKFSNGNFVTGNNITTKSFKQEDLLAAKFENSFFSLIQFSEIPSAENRQQLKSLGVELTDYISSNAYIASISTTFDFSSAADFKIKSINVIPAMYKIGQKVLDFKKAADKSDSKLIAITLSSAVNKNAASVAIRNAGAMIAVTKFAPENVVFINPATAATINAVAALPFVIYISVQQITPVPVNNNDIAAHGFSSIQSLLGRNLRGKNITVGVGDNADVSTHVDFTGRLINRVFSTPQAHGTHTSGTTVGAGIFNPLYQGMAPKSTLVSQWFNDVITNTPIYVADNNMIATNNSYTTADNGCPGEGVYDVTSNYIDAQMKSYDEVLHVFAAGNDGSFSCSPYPSSFATIKSGWQCAKNVFTVGNLDLSSYTLYSGPGASSKGPVADGRIKPEIVANGTSTISTGVNNTYLLSTGTSMAAPVVTGATALLNERYHQLNSANPKAALLKALMCNTAEDLGNAGPDFTYGFGMLNVRKAVEAMEANQYVVSSTPGSFPVTVPSGARRLKVLLYWADAPAALPAAATLVNDLDLTVSDNPVTVTHLPLILDPSPGNINAEAVEGADHKNNIEQVVIDNPAAGNYLMNVNAFSIPAGPQQYVLTYQVDMNGITVEYPFGGETLVPATTETIRWTAYGDESNSFTVSYSADNGSTWIDINTNVPASARSLAWTVPATISNLYLMRVKRNGGAGYSDQSDFNFVVLGQPTVTATVPCEGFVNLSWGAVGSATSYDIMQLKGDSMEVIANTAATSYLVQGLNSATKYWFGVRAKNGTAFGRRSVSVNTTPASGVCTLPSFDNNFKAVAIVAPVTGRQFTLSALGSSEQIKITIKNLDNAASSGSYPVSYQVNGGSIITEPVSNVIASLNSYTYTFLATYNFSTPGTYTIKAWVKRPGDSQALDDTVTTVIKSLVNAPVTLPVADGFESTTAQDYTTNTIGLDGDDRVDFKTNSTRGRSRSFVNTGFALNGNRAITLDQFPYSASLNTDSLIMTYNAAAYNTGNQLRLDFYYKNHGEDNNPDNKVWIRGSDTSPWIFAYDLVSNQAALGQWKNGVINVNNVLDTVVPAQAITSSFQIKFGQQGNTSANVSNPIVDQDDGYTFDDVKLSEAFDDVTILNVVSPTSSGCNSTGNQTVTINIKNFSSNSFSGVPVSYRINGGTIISDVIPFIGPNSTQLFSFSTQANLIVNTDYSFDVWLTVPSDTYRTNDSVVNYFFHTSPSIPVTAAQPYLEDFETTDGSWYTKGTNSSWQWGAPAKTIINKAPNGSKIWTTNLTGNYNDNEFSYLYSPCFDLSGLTQPEISFSHIYDVESGFDYTWIEYSADGGITWNKLGNSSSGTNWYDVVSPARWGVSKTKWHVASTDIPTTSSTVRFRIAMSSDGGLDKEGIGIDDIHIFEKVKIYTGPDITTGITQNITGGTNWIDFLSGGKLVASINPNSNALGITNAFVYFNPAVPERYSANRQYYLDRNIVIKVSNNVLGPTATVRYYFTEAEAKALMNATGCGNCVTIADPYESGVTQYSEPGGTNEDGTLSNNLSGLFQFKLPANVLIIPYDSGYYAEFPVSGFSEFWINNGGLGGTLPLPVSMLSFEAAKQHTAVALQWITEAEINTATYSIERSSDGINYSTIGTVFAINSNNRRTYDFTDVQPLAGMNYYRLKITDKNGVISYSSVRKINFQSNGDDIMIYPNPVTNGVITIAASVNCTTANLYDAAGKLIQVFQLKGRTNTVTLTGIAKGLYQLKVIAGGIIQTEKIIIE
jgi:hypothetical protein